MIMTGCVVARPLYTIRKYNDSTYGICKFKRHESEYRTFYEEPEPCDNDSKLDNTFSRARSMIRDYGLSNEWDYFVTITLDPTKYNRYDLGKFKTEFMRWVVDERKRYVKLYGPGNDKYLKMVIVPENHKDGAWHMHGLLSNIPEGEFSKFEVGKHPQRLVDGGFLNWNRYAGKFGFCSLGLIRDQVKTVLYTTKYIDKNVEALAGLKGQHLYIPTRGLNRSAVTANVYAHNSELDKMLSYHGEFCSTGLVVGEDWTYSLDYDDDIPYFTIDEYAKDDFDPISIDPTYGEYENLSLFGGS